MNDDLNHKPRRWTALGLLALAIALAVPFVTDDPSHLNLAILALMTAQVGVAWNLLGGYAGQVSLGHAAFYGLGAYASTLLLVKFGVNPWLGMLAGGLTAAVLSMGMGWSCLRLKGHYFTMATLAVAEIVQIVFTNWEYAGTAVGLTIPMALLVGLLIGLGRMSADRESVALLACGVSPYRLLRPVMTIAVVATAATMYVMIEAIPDSNQRYREVLFEILTKRVESEIRPRVFYDDFPQYTLYPQDEAGPGEVGWRNLLVANTGRSDAIELFMARRGRIDLDPKQRTIRLVLTDGTQYSTGKPGESSTLRFHGTYNILSGNFTPFVTAGLGWTYIDTNIPSGLPESFCWYYPWWGQYCGTYVPTHDTTKFSYNAGAGLRLDVGTAVFRFLVNSQWVDFGGSYGSASTLQEG